MTKKEAHAILTCQRKIFVALVECESKLQGDNKTFMVNYWGAHVRSAMSGVGYGSAPIVRAQEKVLS